MKINKEHWAKARAHKKKHKGVLGFLIFAIVYLFVLPAEGQQQNRIPRIGYLSRGLKPTATTPDLKADAFLQKLRDLGYVEGKNIQVEFYYAEGKGERFPEFVTELIERKVDVLVSGTIQAIRAAKQATKTIPIVIVTQADPTASGLVKSLARPGETSLR